MTDFKTILCVEDNKDSRELLHFALGEEGFQVVSCSTSEEGLKLAEESRFSAIILDHRLADTSEVEICRRIGTYDKQTPIIFLTAATFAAERAAGLAAGANNYLVKPLDFERIAEIIRRLIS